jgi:hypothetical protein
VQFIIGFLLTEIKKINYFTRRWTGEGRAGGSTTDLPYIQKKTIMPLFPHEPRL